MSTRLHAGRIVWVDLGETRGREQAGHRPCLVVSSAALHSVADTMATVVPCTTRARPWDNHVPLRGNTGLPKPTFAITEQLRTISGERIGAHAGSVDAGCLEEVLRWVRAWLHST